MASKQQLGMLTQLRVAGAMQRAFNRVWDELAERGTCDERGSCEYERVLGEFMEGRFKDVISGFICASANRKPLAPPTPLPTSADYGLGELS